MPDTAQPCSYNGSEQQYCVHLAEHGPRDVDMPIYLGVRQDGIEAVLYLCEVCWALVTGAVLREIAEQAIARLLRAGALPGLAPEPTPPSAAVNPGAEDAALRELMRDRGGIVSWRELPAALSAAVLRALQAGWLQSYANTGSYVALELAWKGSDGSRAA